MYWSVVTSSTVGTTSLNFITIARYQGHIILQKIPIFAKKIPHAQRTLASSCP